jgi:putative heme-binding domain-containing protein
MNRFPCVVLFAILCFGATASADEPKFQSLFDGKTLSGWQGEESLWSVQDGAIVGQTTAEAPIKGNTFLVWQGGEIGDLEFRCQVRFKGNNSGVQYRSKVFKNQPLVLAGYQADLHPKPAYMGMMYGEKTGRGIIATGGQQITVAADGKKSIQKIPAAPATAPDQWNDLRIIAVGNRMIHQINGVTIVDVTDDHAKAVRKGLIGLQLHQGQPMKVEFRRLELRRLNAEDGVKAIADLIEPKSDDETKSSPAEVDEEKKKDKQPDSTKASAEQDNGIYAPPGFVVERVHSATEEQGSWVSLTTDPQGRIYACDQGDAGLFRVTVQTDADPLVEKVSIGPLEGLSGAQGLEWALDSLWFHTNGGNLLRLTDSDSDDKLDTQETIPGTTGGGEHGNHAVLTSADSKAILMVGGNAAPLADHVRSTVPTWYEGQLLPRMGDARGHARGRMAPGGWITRLDPKTKSQTVMSIGYRNQYDIALNRQGDLFTYDADMEWDMGLPWYRPTRICLAVSGSDYGWRNGSGKWPSYYEDTLPPTVELGPGSPTGLLSGQGADFPTKYQDAIFALDWTFGTIYAVHLVPEGAGYRGKVEPFVYSSPLPLTDAVIGKDGNLYFAVGGRGMTSGLFRVRYVGDDARKAPTAHDEKAAKARQQRRVLEAFHGVQDETAIDLAWPFLSSEDRFIRHAARIAIESQPVDDWANRVSQEPNPQARITASVALGRVGRDAHFETLIQNLLELDPKQLHAPKLLGLLRAYAIAFTEIKQPSDSQRKSIIEALSPMLPDQNPDVNTELIRVLSYLRDPTLPARVMDLIQQRSAPVPPKWSELAQRNSRYGKPIAGMLESYPPTVEIGYAFMIRNLKVGWNLELRREYFEFLNQAAKASGGASFAGYMTRIRNEALASCNDEERKALEGVTGENFNPEPAFALVDPVGPGKKWTVEQVKATIKGTANFERGRSLFFTAKCASCHRLQGLGGAIGPDLTSVPNKFDDNYLVEAIIHPSKDISDQYGSSRILTDDGRILTGLAIEKADGGYTVYPSDSDAKPVEVADDEVEMIEASKVSQMPADLLNRLNAEEVRDLIAYIMAGGSPTDRRYSPDKKK